MTFWGINNINQLPDWFSDLYLSGFYFALEEVTCGNCIFLILLQVDIIYISGIILFCCDPIM